METIKKLFTFIWMILLFFQIGVIGYLFYFNENFFAVIAVIIAIANWVSFLTKLNLPKLKNIIGG